MGSKLEHCYWVSFKGSIANLRKISQSVEGTFECLLSVFSIQPYFSSLLCCFLFVTCWRNPKWNCIVKMTRITPTLTSDAELWLCMVVSIIRTSRRNQWYRLRGCIISQVYFIYFHQFLHFKNFLQCVELCWNTFTFILCQ